MIKKTQQKSTAFATVLLAPLATLFFVSRWRHRRRISSVPFWIEVVFGLLLGAASFVFLVIVWGFASLE